MSTSSLIRYLGLSAVAAFAITGSWNAAADDTVTLATGGYANSFRNKEFMHTMDTNGDGMISRAEWDAFQEKVFTALDVHKKGSLSTQIFVERRCQRLVSFATGGFSNYLCTQATGHEIDTDADGRITRDEFMAYQGKIFDSMDTSRTHPGMLGDQEMFATGGANRTARDKQ
ncbi:MAG: EF-hand domain-containing protein [Sinobacteraceae bacterium]|nr:EF-hand domain-containing protein [Nevskiaceae bacterium]